MKKNQFHIACLLILGLFSLIFIIPSNANAQIGGITSNKMEENPNDDEKLCNSTNEWATNNSFCNYYSNYKTNVDTNKPKAQEYRNRMIDLLKIQIDDIYNNHKNGRVTHTKWFQTILDILGIGLAFSGNIVGGLRNKTVLAATSGSFQAGRNSVNDRFHLLQQQILINKMSANRLDQWANIVGKKKLGVDEFSWDNAKADLQQYLFRGSFTDALDSLVEQTGAQVQTAQSNLNVVLNAVSQTVLTAKLKNFKEYLVPMNTMASKLDAEIKQTTDADKKSELEKKKASLLENYRNICLGIKIGGDFAVLDQKVRTTYGSTPSVMTPYDNVFNNIQSNPSVITFADYDFALASINEFAGKETDLNNRFLAILQLYKIS
jgi:hypothetical protein